MRLSVSLKDRLWYLESEHNNVDSFSVTILNQNLGSCETTMHGSHMQRTLPLFILLNTENETNVFMISKTIVITYSMTYDHQCYNTFLTDQGVYLHIDVSTIVDEQLEAQHPTGGCCSQMQWCAAMVVGLSDIGATVYQFAGHSVLPGKTGHMERCVPKNVRFISLKGDVREKQLLKIKWTFSFDLYQSVTLL